MHLTALKNFKFKILAGVLLLLPLLFNSAYALALGNPLIIDPTPSSTVSGTKTIQITGVSSGDGATLVWIGLVIGSTCYQVIYPSGGACTGLPPTSGGPAQTGLPGSTSSFSWNTTLAANGTYTLYAGACFSTNNCSTISSWGYTTNSNITVNNSTSTAPTVDIKANDSNGPIYIDSGTAATLKWTSTNATACGASGGWSGSKPTNGTQSTGALTNQTTFTLTCTNGNSSSSDSVTVNINSPSYSQGTYDSQGSYSSGGGSSGGGTSGSKSQSSSTTQVTEKVVTSEPINPNSFTTNQVVEEEIPVSVSEFDPSIFLTGENIKLNSIKNLKKDNKTYLHFDGTTKPNTLVTLYVFSNPVIVTVKSDAKGNWSYDRGKGLDSGKHSAFATIYDDGVTRRSAVKNFFLAKSSVGSLVLGSNNFDISFFYILVLVGAMVVSLAVLIAFRVMNDRRLAKL